jgi:hypothetical protein
MKRGTDLSNSDALSHTDDNIYSVGRIGKAR